MCATNKKGRLVLNFLLKVLKKIILREAVVDKNRL